MEQLRILTRSNNLEIISKLMNSVAKQYDCKVTYCREDATIRFHGKADYRKPITEQVLSYFSKAA